MPSPPQVHPCSRSPLHLAYISQVHMSVLESSRRAPGVYERKVVMHARGEEIMQVRVG